MYPQFPSCWQISMHSILSLTSVHAMLFRLSHMVSASKQSVSNKHPSQVSKNLLIIISSNHRRLLPRTAASPSHPRDSRSPIRRGQGCRTPCSWCGSPRRRWRSSWTTRPSTTTLHSRLGRRADFMYNTSLAGVTLVEVILSPGTPQCMLLLQGDPQGILRDPL